MKINVEVVEQLAEIAQIALTEEEAQEHATELNQIVAAMENLQEVDTSNIQPLSHILPVCNILREDEVGETLSEEQTFRNAEEVKDRMFKVPKIV